MADRITGIATLVLLVSLFLPWFGAGDLGFSLTISGLSAHAYLYLVLFLCLAILLYLFARAGWDRLPINVEVAHAPVIMVATGVNCALVLIGFLLKTGGSATGWEIGAWLALIASITALAPIAVPAIQARSGGR